jgi:polyferredoxin
VGELDSHSMLAAASHAQRLPLLCFAVLCMECLKACPHRSIEFRLRLPGVELWTSHKPLLPEVCLMFMLLGAGEARPPGMAGRRA